MSRKSRVSKMGYVYLLNSSVRSDHYKFGCTSKTPQERCRKINSETGLDFKVVCSFKSFDMYKDESLIKSDILPHGLGFLGEFFDLCDLLSQEDLIERFLTIGGVLEKQ